MIGKFINLKTDIEKNNDRTVVNPKYLNFLNEKADVYSYETIDGAWVPASDFLHGSTRDILYDYSITECLYSNTPGVIFDLFASGSPLVGQESWNSAVFQFNKMDGDLINSLFTGQVVVELIDKVTFATYKKIVFDPSIEIDTMVGDVYTTKKCNLDMGIILIDKEILKHFGVTSVSSEDYYICLYHTALTQFEVANASFTNSYEVFFDINEKFGLDNLNGITVSAESGRSFIKANEFLRTFSASMKMLDAEEFGDIYSNILFNNKSFPVYIFPYCESSDDETLAESLDSYIYNRKNFLLGGLFLLNGDLSFSSPLNDHFEFDIKAKECV